MANATGRRLRTAKSRIGGLERDMIYEMRGAVRRRQDRLARVAGKLEALSPLSALARGYAVALDENGRVLRSVDDFETNEAFTLRVTDGRIRSRVVDVEPEQHDE
jgi:exodeoxyribonuclease VII large subunit